MGRYWDDPGAGILQHLGAGSVVYVFCLSFVLWVVVYPLRPKNWSYFHILTFISLVSPPAMLYAIPVEQFMSLAKASELNMWFLLMVATWRVALLLFFLARFAAMSATARVKESISSRVILNVSRRNASVMILLIDI